MHHNAEITTRPISVLETSRSRRGKGAYKIVRDRTATQRYDFYKTESKRKRSVSHRASLFSYLVLRRIVFYFRLFLQTIRCVPTLRRVSVRLLFYFTPPICWFIGLLPSFLFFVKVPFVAISHLILPPLTFFNFLLS